MRARTLLLAALVLTSADLGAPALAAILEVPADYVDIASALAAAVAGDEVVVAAGTYQEHDLILPSGVALRGATGNPADVVIDGERAGRCVYGAALDATTRLAALTLANGLPTLGATPHNSWGAGEYGGGIDPGFGVILEAAGTTIPNNTAPTGRAARRVRLGDPGLLQHRPGRLAGRRLVDRG